MNGSEHETLLFATPDELVEEVRNGRIVVLVDDVADPPRAAFVMAAQLTTPEGVNFMARDGCGITSLALTEDKVEQLGLTLLAAGADSLRGTAFTTSIESRAGVTTGISAHDRARTISAALNSDDARNEITTPGHVFPIMVRDGGVLIRAGLPEAAVDLARMAGLKPAGVLCDLVDQRGELADLSAVRELTLRDRMKIGKLTGLLVHRCRHDPVLRSTGTSVVSLFGRNWHLRAYRDESAGLEHLALQLGEVRTENSLYVGSPSPLEALVSAWGPDAGDPLRTAFEEISGRNAGVILLLGERSSWSGAKWSPNQLDGHSGIVAQILSDLGMAQVRLLPNSAFHLAEAAHFGIQVTHE